MNEPAQVLIVDDQVLYREGLRELMRHWSEFEVVGEASNGREAVEFCNERRVDLVLMDVSMPEMDGLEATRLIRDASPNVAVVMLTISDDESHLFGSLCAGACGYILKDMPARQLRNRLQGVLRGEGVLSGAITAKVIERAVAATRTKCAAGIQNPNDGDELTEREAEIVRLVAEGHSNEEIGAHLFLSAGTVKKQLSSIMQRLYLENRVQVAVYAIKSGIAR